jgi:hypothetical protein
VLRYGIQELLLVQPGTSAHRPARDPNAPHIREALERAERDRGEGRTMKDWSDADRRAWINHPQGLERALAYNAARHPRALAAPAPWPQELSLLLGEALVASLGGKLKPYRRGAWRWVPVLVGGLVAMGRLRKRAERRQAVRLRLGPDNTPRPVPTAHLAVFTALSLADAIYRWRRRPETYPWALQNAASVIRALDRRHAWRQAYRARETSVPSVQSSASP